MEDGHWTNVDSSTRSITKVDIEFVCRDVHIPGEPPKPSYYINLFGSCHPTDCDWGVAGGNRDSSGWIRTTIDHGYATRHVWVQGYDSSGVDWLRVYIWTDFHDRRQDYASDEWFLRS
ncbi:MAG: hypothetical protein AAGF95_02080 [Chloroflexota bacterium]